MKLQCVQVAFFLLAALVVLNACVQGSSPEPASPDVPLASETSPPMPSSTSTTTPVPSITPSLTATHTPSPTILPYPSFDDLLVPDELAEVSFDGLAQVWVDSDYSELGLIDTVGKLVYQATYALESDTWVLDRAKPVRIGKDGSITTWDPKLKALAVSSAPPLPDSMIETLRSVDLAGLHSSDSGRHELVNSLDQVVVYNDDADGVWLFAIDMVQKMEQARANNEKKIITLDLNGIEVTIDVVPPEVVAQGRWDWNLRGFVKETESGLEVWRTRYGPVVKDGSGEYPDLSAWHLVMDVMDLREHGLGVFTIEVADPELLAQGYMIPGTAREEFKDLGDARKPALKNPRFEAREVWVDGMLGLWKDQDTWTTLEVKDYHELQRGTAHSPNFERPETLGKGISKHAGVSVIIVEMYDDSFSVALGNWRVPELPEVAFKLDSQAGRIIIFIFTGDLRKYIKDAQDNQILSDKTTAYMSGNIPVFLLWVWRQQDNEQKADEMIRDMNPAIMAVGGVAVREPYVSETYERFQQIPTEQQVMLFSSN